MIAVDGKILRHEASEHIRPLLQRLFKLCYCMLSIVVWNMFIGALQATLQLYNTSFQIAQRRCL